MDPKVYNPRAIKNKISGAKNELVSPEEYEKFANSDYDEIITDVYQQYEITRYYLCVCVYFIFLIFKKIYCFGVRPIYH